MSKTNLTEITILSIASWGAPKTVNTKNGPRNLRTAPAGQDFWNAWKGAKAELKQAGVSCRREKDGNWTACWWTEPDHTSAEKVRNVEMSKATDADITFPAPEGFEARGYQRAGLAYMMEKDNILLADDMGLGKTIQIIGVLNADESINKALIVCPASLKLNWERELGKWLTRDLKVEVVNGAQTPSKDANIYVINYDILTRHEDWIRGTDLKPVEWDFLACDEAHYLKNPTAKRTKVIIGDYKNRTRGVLARRKVMATGTPIPNRVREGFTLFNYLRPDLFPTFKSFAHRYCFVGQTEWGANFDGATNTDELQHILRSNFMIRRTKDQVLTELPGKVRQTIPLNGFAALVAKEAEILGKMGFDYDCEDWGYALKSSPYFEELAIVRHMLALAKAPSVAKYVEDLLQTQDKVIVMGYHKDVVEVIERKLEKYGVTKVVGGMSSQAKQDAVDEFQNGDARVFVGNINAAGVGFTLTASDQVVFAELDWTPGNMEQAEDRANRMGQTNLVDVHYVVAAGSMDQKLAGTLDYKRENITAVLDDEYDINQWETPAPVSNSVTVGNSADLGTSAPF